MSDNKSIEQFIDNEVKANDVVLFMKGTPQFPMCGFSGQVVQILDYLGVTYKGLNVLENDDLRGGIKSYSNWPTIPQLYVKGEFVGGCDIIREMFQAGELQSLLKDKGVAVKEQRAPPESSFRSPSDSDEPGIHNHRSMQILRRSVTMDSGLARFVRPEGRKLSASNIRPRGAVPSAPDRARRPAPARVSASPSALQ